VQVIMTYLVLIPHKEINLCIINLLRRLIIIRFVSYCLVMHNARQGTIP
jgi:hypothetical protein